MGLFGKSKAKLKAEDEALIKANIEAMAALISIFENGNETGETREKYTRRFADMKAFLESFEPFDEVAIINTDKTISEALKKAENALKNSSGVIDAEAKAAVTELRDLINERNEVE